MRQLGKIGIDVNQRRGVVQINFLMCTDVSVCFVISVVVAGFK